MVLAKKYNAACIFLLCGPKLVDTSLTVTLHYELFLVTFNSKATGIKQIQVFFLLI